jgi:hypothetical protein
MARDSIRMPMRLRSARRVSHMVEVLSAEC